MATEERQSKACRGACGGLQRGFGFPILLIFPSRASRPLRDLCCRCRCCTTGKLARAAGLSPGEPAIYASVESVRCCGQLSSFKENQELWQTPPSLLYILPTFHTSYMLHAYIHTRLHIFTIRVEKLLLRTCHIYLKELVFC